MLAGSQFSLEQVRVFPFVACLTMLCIDGLLDLTPKLPGDDGFVDACPNMLFVGDLANVDRVGKDAINVLGRQRLATVRDAARADPVLGGVTLSSQLLRQFQQGLCFQIPPEYIFNKLGFPRKYFKMLINGLVAKWRLASYP